MEIDITQFQEDVGKAFESLECPSDTKLSDIGKKIEHLETDYKKVVGEVEVKAQVNLLEKRSTKLGTAFSMLEDNLKQRESDSARISQIVEEVDNNLRRSNLRLRSLKEGIEGDSLKTYLETLLTGCLGSDTDGVVQLDFVFRIRSLSRKDRRSKDRGILMRFTERKIKTLILDHLWDSPRIVLEGQELSF